MESIESTFILKTQFGVRQEKPEKKGGNMDSLGQLLLHLDKKAGDARLMAFIRQSLTQPHGKRAWVCS